MIYTLIRKILKQINILTVIIIHYNAFVFNVILFYFMKNYNKLYLNLNKKTRKNNTYWHQCHSFLNLLNPTEFS